MLTDRRAEATRVALSVADRLAEPDVVRDRTVRLSGDGTAAGSVWRQQSLSAGHPGVALLFAELAAHDGRWVPPLHAHLMAAIDQRHRDESGEGVGAFSGTGSVATAVQAARRATGGYRRVHDNLVAVSARQTLRQTGVPVDGPIVFPDYDLVGGPAGNLLLSLSLADGAPTPDAAAAAVAAADWLCDLVLRPGDRPGWWVEHGPDPHAEPPPGGHGNLGMAHGAAGILAALTRFLAEPTAPSRVGSAVDRLAGALLPAHLVDRHGPWWPMYIVDGTPPDRRRPESWCYGSTGIGWALGAAGRARDRPDWTALAVRATEATIEATAAEPPVDTGLCHGWAGWAHTLWRWDPERYATAIDHAMDRILADFDPDAAFGFRCRGTDGPLDHPGFLEGAAGTALVLYRYGTDTAPVTGWDRLLLP